jgi:hypothetical protein
MRLIMHSNLQRPRNFSTSERSIWMTQAAIGGRPELNLAGR